MTENAVDPSVGPSQHNKETWWFALAHEDGRLVRYRLEERGGAYCFTTRKRGFSKNGVTVSQNLAFDLVRGGMMACMKRDMQEGFALDQRQLRLWHALTDSTVRWEIEENVGTVDFRDDSYRLAKFQGKGKDLSRLADFPVKGWTSLKEVRASLALEAAAYRAAGYGDLPIGPAPANKPQPSATTPGVAWAMEDWQTFHFKGGNSDKVYSVELWKKFSVQTVTWLCTARHGRRNSTLVGILKKGPTNSSEARRAFDAEVRQRYDKSYKRVEADKLGIARLKEPKLPDAPTTTTMTPEQLKADPLVQALKANKDKAASLPVAAPLGVEFWCDACNCPLDPRTFSKSALDDSATFGFGHHGLRATRSFTAPGLLGIEERMKKGMGGQRVNIYNMDGSVAAGAVLQGQDHQTASDAAKALTASAPKGGPTIMVKAKQPEPKYTVNDPPAAKTVGVAGPIATFGKRKVRFASGDDGEDA